MHFLPSGPDSWYNLPRDKGVAYVAQESWVQNETIKVSSFSKTNNVVTHNFNRITYCSGPHTTKTVIKRVNWINADFFWSHTFSVIVQCGLERDLLLFEAGDLTEVGEKGLTLRFVSSSFPFLQVTDEV